MITRFAAILAKKESVYGTDPTPDGTNDAILVEDLVIQPNVDIHEMNHVRGTLSKLPSKVGLRWVDIQFTTELKGSGTAGTPPDDSPLFQACGFGETDGATDVVYAPVSSSFSSCTIYAYRDGLRYIVTGCRGSFVISGEAGGFLKIRWHFIGLYVNPTDVAMPTVTVDTTRPVTMVGNTFTYGAYAFKLNTIELSINNVIAKIPSVAAAAGFSEITITDRRVIGKMQVSAILVAARNVHANLLSENTAALQLIVGATAGNIVTLDSATGGCIKRGINWAEKEGIAMYDIEFEMFSPDGDDELTITLT